MHASPPAQETRDETARVDEEYDTRELDSTARFPFFCERELWVGWRDGTFPATPSDYMSLICMCALSAQHVGNRALFTDDTAPSESAGLSQDYLKEAVRLTDTDFDGPNINVIRSYGFLALLGAQEGNTAMVHKYLALYHGLCAQFGLHDESRWPLDTTDCDREVRRRLWWAMYRLEVHTACVLGSLVRCPEAHSDVGYPCGIHHPAFIPGRDGKFENWFEGWNLTTDLYRVLEHAISEFRAKNRDRRSILQDRQIHNTSQAISQTLSKIQAELLPQFGTATTRSADNGRNRCGFQASNILCTIHLARMISSVSSDDSLHSAFQTARNMMDNMVTIPIEYVRAVGSPLVQQLAGVGHMLVSVAVKHRLSELEYETFREVLVSMIRFLGNLESFNNAAVAAKQRLTSRLADLDEHVSQSTEEMSLETVSHMQLGWSPYLDTILNESNREGADIFSTNLLDSFTWPYGSIQEPE
ncbi:hypothetical protein CkaCkLH20_05098 [Colletotrichum karsti]|uniref:Xylanolytic transcriptional activator regulatory domain-containing protein n=1 Tax=Colletotrichum karsti TaxID=1095194 RepID=A0A9P6I6R6_9PEZI|nr:uncharacterized protein CkaCkLH20_05098 [Colletotrichum karsti]KAF9877398.1 hypothetical protein CkaCkLH20_05098 [Colletotrichum karsti]